MKIGLIGYGKMGKAIEQIATERGHTITFRVNSQNRLEDADFSGTDIAIEFTQPALAPAHIRFCLERDLPVVVGTTAWKEHLPGLESLAKEKNASFLYASNFSVGVNLLFRLNEELARLMGQQNDYSAAIEETHHVQKLDAPSGTAVSLAEGIIANNPRYTGWTGAENAEPEPEINEVGIKAVREPEVPGTHHVRWISEIDTITLTHEAHNRRGFALGSVIAAEFLHGKKGVFTMRDVLSI
jgi:4-hydroxy-tetrahydrodipicolinate reductase